jgi:hypothetical protein
MGDDGVEQLWYIFWLVKAMIALCLFGAVTLICTSAFGLLRSKRAKQRSFKQPIVHSLGTIRSYRNFDASESKAVNLRPNNTTKRVG